MDFPFQLFSPVVSNNNDSNNTILDVRENTANRKQKKRIRACVNCQKSHIACEIARPCHRCIEKGIENTCTDTPKKKRKKENPTNDVTEYVPSSSSPIVSLSPTETQTTIAPDTPTNIQSLDFLFAPVADLEAFIATMPLDTSVPKHKNTPLIEEDDIYDPQKIDPLCRRVDFFPILLEYIKENIPEMLEDAKSLLQTLIPRLNMMLSNLPKEKIVSMYQDFNQEMEFAKVAYERMNIPTLIYDKTHTIYYCNEAFRTFTGFKGAIPTKRFAIFDMISHLCWKKTLHTVISAFIDGTTKYLMLPTDWFCYGKFMKVNIVISIKRDVIGLPLVLTAHMLPNLIAPCMDTQVPMLSKRLFD